MSKERQNIDVQAPAAHKTVDVFIVPLSVTTADTAPPDVSIPRTAQAVKTFAPCCTAALAIAGVARCGSARPSLSVYIAPAQPSAEPCTSCCNSLEPIRRVPISYSLAIPNQSSCSCNSFSEFAVQKQPPRTNPTSSPISSLRPSQMRILSRTMGISLLSLPCARTQPQFRPDCSPAIWPFSQSTTSIPFLARNQAVDTPTMPPPMMTTSAAAGTASGGSSDCVQVCETVFSRNGSVIIQILNIASLIMQETTF